MQPTFEPLGAECVLNLLVGGQVPLKRRQRYRHLRAHGAACFPSWLRHRWLLQMKRCRPGREMGTTLERQVQVQGFFPVECGCVRLACRMPPWSSLACRAVPWLLLAPARLIRPPGQASMFFLVPCVASTQRIMRIKDLVFIMLVRIRFIIRTIQPIYSRYLADTFPLCSCITGRILARVVLSS